jgi:hypothetical protein
MTLERCNIYKPTCSLEEECRLKWETQEIRRSHNYLTRNAPRQKLKGGEKNVFEEDKGECSDKFRTSESRGGGMGPGAGGASERLQFRLLLYCNDS